MTSPFRGQPNGAYGCFYGQSSNEKRESTGTERNDTRYGEAGWWMEQFNDSDVDRNGNLNLYEFREYVICLSSSIISDLVLINISY